MTSHPALSLPGFPDTMYKVKRVKQGRRDGDGSMSAVVEIDGREMVSVPGGTHWGGGLRINSRDHARFGLLIQRDGNWGDRRLLPRDWIRALREPCPLNAQYGFLWWLNTNRVQYPSAPETSFFAVGAGSNLIWIDQELDVLIVSRWIDQAAIDPMIAAFMKAME